MALDLDTLSLPTPAAQGAESFLRRAEGRYLRRSSQGASGSGASGGASGSGGAARIRIRSLQIRFREDGGTAPETIRRAPAAEQVLPKVRPRAVALAKGGTQSVPPGFERTLARSPGQPLSPELAARFSAVFGTDFEGVRIHTDGAADQASAQIQARAFTLGSDIYFRRGEYAPSTASGQALIGHELTHVAQQQGGSRTLRLAGPIHAPAAAAGERVAARSSGTLHTAPATSELSDLERERLRAVREILAYEDRHGTWETIQHYNAITGDIPGRNVWVRTSEGNVADLCWMFDVAWAAGVTGGTASDVLGGAFGRPGQMVGAALTTSAVGLSYWGARFAGAAVEGFDRGSWSAFGSYLKGSLNEDNLGGANLALRLSVNAALGEQLKIRDVLHPTVLEQVERLPLRRAALEVGARDGLELQAEQNERAILQAASTGGGWERLLGEGAQVGQVGRGGVFRSLQSEVHAERAGSGLVGKIQRRAQAGQQLVDGARGFGDAIQRKAQGGGVLRRAGGGMFGNLFGGGGTQSNVSVSVPGGGSLELAGLTILWPEARATAGAIQRKPGPGMELAQLRGSGASAGMAPPTLMAQLDASQAQGLSPTLQDSLEALLAADFSRVRIHTDPAAQGANELVGAEAFTLGEDIYFNTGRFAPNSARGLALLVHELTHVAQGQGGAPTLGARQGAVAGPLSGGGGLVVAGHDSLELQAERNERFVLHSLTGAGPRGLPVAGALAREGEPGLGVSHQLTSFAYAGGPGSGSGARGGAGFGAGAGYEGGFGGGMRLSPKLRAGYPGSLALKAQDDAGGPTSIPNVSDSKVDGLVELFKGMGGGVATLADLGIGFVPIVGDVYDALCAIVGRSLFTWQQLDVWERILCLAGAIPIPFITGGLLRRGAGALKWLVSEKRAISILSQVLGSAVAFVKRYATQAMNWLRASKLARLGKQVGATANKLASSVMSAQDLVGIYRTAQRQINRKFLHYHNLEAGTHIKASGRIGKDGAVGVFATPMDPLLGASDSLIGRLARNAMLGGTLDFKLKGSAWKFWDLEVTKKSFETATEFTTANKKAFSGTNLGKIEKGAGFKQIFLQKGAIGVQDVEVIAQHALKEQGLPDGLIAKFAPLIGATLSAGVLAAIAKAPDAIGTVIDWVIPWVYETVQAFGTAWTSLQGILFKDRAGGRATRFAERLRARYVERSPEAMFSEWGEQGSERGLELAQLREVSTLGAGLPLEWSLRNRLEDAIGGGYLGADLSMVRLHTSARAASLAHSMDAEAFALEHRIVLGPGSYAPHTAEGLGTLVHEATHVAQFAQGRVRGRASAGRTRALEGEAYATERRAVAQARSDAWGPQVQPGLAGFGAPIQGWRGPSPEAEYRHSPGSEPADIPDAAPREAVPAALSRALKKEASTRNETREADPVKRVMENWRVTGLSRDEFLVECKERLMELMHDELVLDDERRETLSWSPFRPME